MMSTPSQIITKSFLDSCPQETKEQMLSYLPASELEALEHLPPTYQDPSKGIEGSDALLNSFHPSWFEPFLRTLSSHDLSIFLGCFSRSPCKQLTQTLGYSAPLPLITPSAREYLRSLLLQELKKDALPLLPFECLPPNPFNPLLFFSYAQKLQLINLLSMHDLAKELKKIIEKPKLARIKRLLSEEELAYLKSLVKQKEKLSFKTMNLVKWDGDPSTLKTILRQRGINRLSKATFGSDPSFLWHLKHQLDTTSATLFQKLHTSLDDHIATKDLQERALALISIFKDQLPKEGQGT